MRAGVVFSVGLLFSVIVTAATQTHEARQRNDDWVAPPSQAARRNPLAGRPDIEAGGKKVFHQRCTTCHGEGARGTDRGPDLTNPRVQAQSDGALFWKITSGNTRTGMPTFSFLPEQQRWQLVMHVRSHGRDSTRAVEDERVCASSFSEVPNCPQSIRVCGQLLVKSCLDSAPPNGRASHFLK